MPIVGFIDIPNITDKNICDVHYEIKNIVIKPNSAEEHSIYIEFEFEVFGMIYEKKQINLIQDLYSPETNLEFVQKRAIICEELIEKTSDFTINSTQKITELEEGKILDVETDIILSNTKISNSKIYYTGELKLNFIYEKSKTVNSKNVRIPFETSEENVLGTDKINVETEFSIKNADFSLVQKGETNCKVEISTSTKINKNIVINLIDNIEAVEEEEKTNNYNSLILYIVVPGDSLWEIAKKFNSTVDEIAIVNEIKDINNLSVGQKIYIPKYNIIKKEGNINKATVSI